MTATYKAAVLKRTKPDGGSTGETFKISRQNPMFRENFLGAPKQMQKL